MCASLGVHNFCTMDSPICPLLDMSYVPCIRTDNTQFKVRAREHNSWCLMYVCACCHPIYSERLSTPFGIQCVGAPAGVTQEEGQHSSFFSFLGGKRHIGAHYYVLYYSRCVACVCLCVVFVCVQAGVYLGACVSVCALLLNLCYICMADAMCARVCV